MAVVFDRLRAFTVRPAHDRVETGTANFEGIAGTLAATDYLRDVGRAYGDVTGAAGAADASERRRELVAGMTAIVDYERGLVARLIAGLRSIAGVTIHGITDPARAHERVPTVSISLADLHPRSAAEALGRRGIFVWDGDFYATGLIERLGRAESGGVLRIGLVHYNTADEVDRTLETLEDIVRTGGTGE
jgi:selenocysteine lyase/cysteine desulfurase